MDLFGNKKPVQIETKEWWYNGRFIQEQSHPSVPKYISFADDSSPYVEIHASKREAFKFAQENPCKSPDHRPNDFL